MILITVDPAVGAGHIPEHADYARLLVGVFVLALIMGPGPGIELVNPSADPGERAATFLGAPILYVWAVFWFLVMATAVVVAYCKLWTEDER